MEEMDILAKCYEIASSKANLLFNQNVGKPHVIFENDRRRALVTARIHEYLFQALAERKNELDLLTSYFEQDNRLDEDILQFVNNYKKMILEDLTG